MLGGMHDCQAYARYGLLGQQGSSPLFVLLVSGLSGVAAMPRLPACCKIRGLSCKDKTTSCPSCRPRVGLFPTPAQLTASDSARKWGAAKPTCSCLGVWAYGLEPGAKDVWFCDWTIVSSFPFRGLWSAMISCATGGQQNNRQRLNTTRWRWRARNFFTSRPLPANIRGRQAGRGGLDGID